ncbi:hypothetical protein DFP72DRAFT_849012 [Ephemerocybe angulata]|uniref:Uncharacterized protein n=1 Tax=Ephemerocybe angulata TaxID=980116 RepID=A0A8H6M401_9AGAR|nr:hypothetical protein DFP72DRAFT_849012 [Tulosesus angulatus]
MLLAYTELLRRISDSLLDSGAIKGVFRPLREHYNCDVQIKSVVDKIVRAPIYVGLVPVIYGRSGLSYPNALVPRVVIGKGTQLWPPPRKPSKKRPARPGSERQRKTSLKEKIKEIFKFGQKPPPDPGAEGATG